MAKVINILNSGDGDFPVPFLRTLKVKSGTAGSILPGYLIIADGSNPGYVAAAPDDTDTDDVVVGVAASQSTETASADGTVEVETAPYLLVNIFAKTPGSLTRAMVLTNRYTLNVSSGNYTLDQSTTTKGIFRLWDFDDTTTGLCWATIQCTAF